MINLRLLAAALCASAASFGTVAHGQTVMSLNDIFLSAETHSAQLRPSLSAQKLAESEVNVAKTAMLPDINANLSLGYIANGFTTARNFSDYQAAKIPHLQTGLGISISQPVYTGGATTAAIQLAELQASAARFAADLQHDNIRFQLAGYYLDIYKCRNLLEVLDANIHAADKVLADMRLRFEQGIALQNDITRYELLVADLNLQRVKLRNTLDILNANLVAIAGLPESTVVVPDTTILSRSLPSCGEGYWQAQAATKAPSLLLAQRGIDIGRKAEALVCAQRLPTVGVQAGWTLDGPILTEVPPINRNLSYWWAGINVSYNLSSLYKSNKSLTRSRISTQKAIDDFDAARQGIELGVRADYIRYLEAYEDLKTQQKRLELAELNYNVTDTRYSADMALITDMLDAANSRLDAGQQLVNARINIIYYYYKLLFISGQI